MTRENAISNLLNEYKDALIVSSTGKISRELFELRKKRKERTNDFYMQGSMGCAIPIALGLALNCPSKKVLCLTGDGAVLMKLGSLATVLKHKPDNLEIIVLNNNSHESTGGQPTNFDKVKFFVKQVCRIIEVEPKSRKDLGRPNISCKQITRNFRKNVEE